MKYDLKTSLMMYTLIEFIAATAIENELNKTGITTILIETMSEKNVYARRKAIAALGEYLFYAAT